MALTLEERAKIRYHLGYLNTNVGHALALGLVSASQLLFIVERNMDSLLNEAEFLVRRAVSELDCIEDQLSASRENYATRRVDEVHFDTNQEGRLQDQYLQWSDTLADLLGATINPFSKRHRFMRGEVVMIEPV